MRRSDDEAQQEALAFEAMRSLDADAIGVQEITDPGAFAAAARRRLIVVHLKAAGDGAPRRRDQLLALRPRIIEAMRTGERVVLLGDFNATGDEDRREIAALAEATGMAWASEGLGCTSYWSRRDGCVGTALDHVLTWRAPRGIRARGPCETEGCAARESCPIFHRDVSDHCPVTVDLR